MFWYAFVMAQLLYCDRVQKRGIEQPRTYPIISAWNKDMIQERMKLEAKSQFGLGSVLQRIEIHAQQQVKVQQQDSEAC